MSTPVKSMLSKSKSSKSKLSNPKLSKTNVQNLSVQIESDQNQWVQNQVDHFNFTIKIKLIIIKLGKIKVISEYWFFKINKNKIIKIKKIIFKMNKFKVLNYNDQIQRDQISAWTNSTYQYYWFWLWLLSIRLGCILYATGSLHIIGKYLWKV